MFAIKATFDVDDVQISTKLFETELDAQDFIDSMSVEEILLAQRIDIIEIPTFFDKVS